MSSQERSSKTDWIENELVTVIVPVYNEGTRIVENLDLLISEVESHFAQFEILVVSDGSTDETNFKVFQFKYPGLRLLPMDHNTGKGAAIRRGFQESRGAFVFFIDGGMELHPKELRVFFGLMELYHADVVVGSKRHPQSKVDYPWFRRLLSGIFQLWIRGMFALNVTDTQVGMKLFRRAVVNAVLPHLETDRYGFDLEILSLATRLGFDRILEAPVQMDYFARNQRWVGLEILHVIRVGASLMKDTWKLFWRLQKLPKEASRSSAQSERRSDSSGQSRAS